MGNLRGFNPLQNFMQGTQARGQFDALQQQQQMQQLQQQLAEQGGGLDNPLTQQIAALSNNPIQGFEALDSSKQKKIVRNAEKNAMFIRRGQPERALSSAVFDRNKLIDLDPNIDTS